MSDPFTYFLFLNGNQLFNQAVQLIQLQILIIQLWFPLKQFILFYCIFGFYVLFHCIVFNLLISCFILFSLTNL